MNVTLRKFSENDIPFKVKWINDSQNNTYLHYDLPLREDATLKWLWHTKSLDSRLDMTILCDGDPVGIVGLLGIDRKNSNAELYITVGEPSAKGKGIAGRAMEEIVRLAFRKIKLERIYLYVETENLSAVRTYEKFGMVREGTLRKEIKNRNGKYVDRYIYSILSDEFEDRYGTDKHDTDL